MGSGQSVPATDPQSKMATAAEPQNEMADPNFIREQELILREITDANRRIFRPTEKTTVVAEQMPLNTRVEVGRVEIENAQINRPILQKDNEEIQMQKRILKMKQKEMQKKNDEIDKEKEELKQRREDLLKMEKMLEEQKALELQLAAIKIRAEDAEAKLKESTQYSMKDPYHYTAPSLVNINQNDQVGAIAANQNRSRQLIAVGRSTVPSPPVAPQQHGSVRYLLVGADGEQSVHPHAIAKHINHQEKVVDLHSNIEAKLLASNDQMAKTSKKQKKQQKSAQNTSQARGASQEKNLGPKAKNMPTQGAFQEKNVGGKPKNMPNPKTASSNFDVINIAENSIGMDYETIFGRFLGKNVTSVKVEDPFIQRGFQIMNFVKFCELLVVKCKNLELISLLTTLTSQKKQNAQEEQQFQLHQLKESLKEHNISLLIEFSTNLHDREITFSTGWVIRIGRGLDIYKSTKNNFSIGYTDYRLRKCHQTSMNIFHRNTVSITNVQQQ